jgi:hypothetical protein
MSQLSFPIIFENTLSAIPDVVQFNKVRTNSCSCFSQNARPTGFSSLPSKAGFRHLQALFEEKAEQKDAQEKRSSAVVGGSRDELESKWCHRDS